MEEIPIRVSVQPGMAHSLQQRVLLKPGPQHGEVVNLKERANMEALQPGFRRLLFKVIDDLALPGGRPGDQKQDVKQSILFHSNLPTQTSRKIKFS